MNQDTTKAVFREVWPGGYVENFSHYLAGSKEAVLKLLQREARTDGHCLEIGCGRGFWTSHLAFLFRTVTCLDVIARPSVLDFSNVAYIEVGDRNFTCSGVADCCMDFVFSFGLFCHLSKNAGEEYLRGMARVMRPGARALIAFANWQRHPTLPKDGQRFANERQFDGATWFYCDVEQAKEMVANAGFVDFQDAIPQFRDTLAIFTKPRHDH